MAAPQARIAFHGFSTGPGGIGKVMLNLINALADQGVAVDILMSRVQGPDLAGLDARVNRIAVGSSGMRAVRSIARYLRRTAPEAVVCNKEKANRDVILARRLIRAQIPVAFRVGTSMSAQLARRSPVKRWLRRSQMRFAYTRADLVIANSEGVARDVLAVTGIAPERVLVLPNPTVPPDLDQRAAESVDHPWLKDQSTPVVLAVGRLTRAKDFPTLLRAFQRVTAERPSRLVILGEGKERSALEALAAELGISDRVALPGYMPNPYAWMHRARVFVLSSAWEGLPNVLIEALACGTPVVATDCPSGPSEILNGGEYGPLVPVGDDRALADAIASTLDRPHSRDLLRRGAAPFRANAAAQRYLGALLPKEGAPTAARSGGPTQQE